MGLLKSDGLTAVSQHLKDETTRVLCDTCGIEVIYNFVDTERYVPGGCGETRAHFAETHDIWHLVTGFGMDDLGEASLVGFYSARSAKLRISRCCLASCSWTRPPTGPKRGLPLHPWGGGQNLYLSDIAKAQLETPMSVS